jgi:hypothetical protein
VACSRANLLDSIPRAVRVEGSYIKYGKLLFNTYQVTYSAEKNDGHLSYLLLLTNEITSFPRYF